MTRRAAAWSSVGVCALIGLCCWQIFAGVLDARHFYPQIALASVPDGTNIQFSSPALDDGNPTWILASQFVNHVAYWLILTMGLGFWVSRGYPLHKTLLRIPISVVALCGGALAAVGVGGLLDGHIDWAVAKLGATPDTMRAIAGQDLLIGVGVAVAATLVNRAMGRALLAAGDSLRI